MREKTEYMVWLLDFYQAMLTEKQQEILTLYYEDDLTFSEIAEQTATSRQAVHDLVSRAGNGLQQLEDKLGLVQRFRLNREKLAELRRLIAAQAPEPIRLTLLEQVDDILQSL
jgi:predicted DNA-binding protein YlxM (UPF0122 family)